MSRIAVAGVIIASTAMVTGGAVRMGMLNFLDPAAVETRVTTTHVDLANFTARTVQGNERRGQIPVKIILQLPGLRTAQVICRTASNLRKAILRDLYRNPIPLGRDNALELGETRTRLLKMANGIMRSNIVTDVIVVDTSTGAKPVGPELATLLDCRKVLALSGTKRKNSGR